MIANVNARYLPDLSDDHMARLTDWLIKQWVEGTWSNGRASLVSHSYPDSRAGIGHEGSYSQPSGFGQGAGNCQDDPISLFQPNWRITRS